MDHATTDTETTDKLVSFIRDKFLPVEIRSDFGAGTPLLELGVLDSLNAARLLNFIRKEIGTVVPPSMIDTENFRDVRSITAMISTLA